jgi:hypothetical protein
MSAMSKAECSANSRYANITCSLTPINATASQLSLNFTFFQEESFLNVSEYVGFQLYNLNKPFFFQFQLRWKQYQKLSNRYIPGFFDVTFDLCKALNNLSNLPRSHPLVLYGESFNPRLLEIIKMYGHPCPYIGKNTFAMVTMARRLEGPLKLIPAADYRADFTMLNDKHNLVTLRLYSSTK